MIRFKPNKILKLAIILVISTLYYLLFDYIMHYDIMTIIAVLGMNFYFVYKSKNNSLLFILFIFIAYCNFSIFAFYWFDLFGIVITNSYVWFLRYPQIMKEGLFVLYLFTTFLVGFFPEIKVQKFESPLFDNCRKESKPFIAIALVIVLIAISAWKILLRVRTGVYSELTLYEYSTIIYIVAFYHSGKNRNINNILLILLILNSLFVFMNGDRGPALQFILIIYGVFFQQKLSKKTILILMFFSIVSLNAIGMWRAYSSFKWSMLAQSYLSLIGRGMTLDTAYASEASGLAMIMLRYDYDLFERLILLLKYLASIFIGSGRMAIDVDLASLAKIAYPYHGGGGTLPNYGYFYLGPMGVVILSALVSRYIKFISNATIETNGLRKCISLYLFATMTRWYLYSPAPLLRGVLLLIVVYSISDFFYTRSNYIK